MRRLIRAANDHSGVSEAELRSALEKHIGDRIGTLKKVLLLPPDLTRMHSQAGQITEIYYEMLENTCEIDIMPALGTHDAMNIAEIREMFGGRIPLSCFKAHDWRKDVIKIGEVPGDFVKEVSDGLLDFPIDVEVNKRIVDKSYDLILSIGQVVPHEVAGMANYSKNIFVGCGGKDFINKSHFLGAVYGMERMMGKDHSPVRKVMDYAQERFLQDAPLEYVLTVTTLNHNESVLEGLFIGSERNVFDQAVELSRQKNLNFLDKPIKKAVVYLDPKEFKSTWLGNKSIYRTRMAIADRGELVVLAPGVKKFGEDAAIDRLIRKYGYSGTEKIMAQYEANEDLKENLSAAAHLIHGSSEGRFSITYAVKGLTREEVEGVGFNYEEYEKLAQIYNPERLIDGYNMLDNGEEIFYISNPALGLWVDKSRIN